MIKALSIFLTIVAGLTCLHSDSSDPAVNGSAQLPAGNVWEKLSVSDSLHAPIYSRVYFFDKSNGLALAPSTLYSTDDGGKSWQAQIAFGEVFMTSMTYQAGGGGWAVGNRLTRTGSGPPVIFRTTDRGTTWSSVNINNLKAFSFRNGRHELNDVCIDKLNKIWIAGDRGIIESEIVGSELKAVSIFHTNSAVNRLLCDSPGAPYAVGRDGLFLRRDGGRWKAQTIGANAHLMQIRGNSESLWTVGHYSEEKLPDGHVSGDGKLLESKDGGNTWMDRTPAKAAGLNDVVFYDNIGWLVGNRGQIYTTDNHGESWIRHDIDIETPLVEIFFLNAKLGWIVGDDQTVLRYEKLDLPSS